MSKTIKHCNIQRQAVVFKRSFDHVLREMSRLNGGVDAIVQKDLVQKYGQDVKNLVDAESVEAKAKENIEGEQVVGDDSNNDGSSGSAGASAATYEEA